MRKPQLGCALRLFALGGGLYVLLEKGWRGHSHWSMFFLGGVCFHGIGQVARRAGHLSRFLRCTLCALCITAAEFCCGCVVNRRLKWNVWDYSAMPFQVMGQICLPYTLLWGLLSAVAMPLYRLCERADRALHR